MQAETRPKAIIKRAIEYKRTKPNGPLKKLFAKIKENVEKPTKFRTRRSFDSDIDSDENEVNGIVKERFNENMAYIPYRKNVNEHRRYKSKYASIYSSKKTIVTTSRPTPTPSTSLTIFYKPMEEPEMIITTEKTVPKVLRAMKGYVSTITNSVARHIGRWWLALS